MSVMESFFQSATKLPMLPKVVNEVMQLLEHDNVDQRKLIDTISRDQVITAKVLRLANSSYYGASRTINTLDSAILLVGNKTLRTLVVASGVTSAFATVPNLDMQKFWRHSLITASIARALAKEHKLEQDAAYVAGLMHSIGQLMIHMVFPTAGADIESVCHDASVPERKAVEHKLLGVDHCEVGAELVGRWNFPEDIQSTIRYYAEPLDAKASMLAAVVYVAAHIAFGLEHKEPEEYIAKHLNPDVADKLGIIIDALSYKLEAYREFVSEAESFI